MLSYENLPFTDVFYESVLSLAPGGPPVHSVAGLVPQGRLLPLHALPIRLWGRALLLPTQV